MILSSMLLAILAGVAFSFAITHLCVYLRRRQPAYNLSFALLCLSIGIYDLFCAALYGASDVEEGARWQKLQTMILTVGAYALVRFVADYTGQGSRRVRRLLGFAVAILVLATAFSPDVWVLSDLPLVKRVALPWGATVTYHEQAPGPLLLALNALGVVAFAYVFVMVMRLRRKGENRRARPLFIALAVFYVGVVNDIAVSWGAYSFVYLIEYCFLALVFLMGQTLLRGVLRAAETETALRDSEARYRSFVEGTNDFIAQIDRRGRVTFVNTSLAARMGCRPKDLLGRRALDFMPENEHEILRQIFSRWLRDKETHAVIEKPLIAPLDERLDVLWTVTSGFNESDEIESVDCFGRDVTAIKRAEEQRRARMDRLQAQRAVIVALATSEAVAGGDVFAVARMIAAAGVEAMGVERVAVWRLSEDSRSLRRIAARERSGMLQFDEVTVDVSSCPRFLESLVSDRAISAADVATDPRALDLAGVGFLGNDVASCLAAPIRGGGRLFGVLSYEHGRDRRVFSEDEIAFAGDVAEQLAQTVLNAERGQAEREHLFLVEAIEQAAEIVVIADRQADILYVNAAFERVTGYARDEVLGKNPRLLNSGRQNEAFYRDLWRTIVGGRAWRGRFTNRKKDGSLYLEEAVISPIRDKMSRISHFVSVKRDITDQVRLEDQLRHALKMEAIGQLAGGVAHDFNNLLTPILGYTELLLMAPADDSTRASLVEIRNAAENARDLTRQLLAFGRKQLIAMRIVDPGEVVSRFARILRRTIREDIEIVLRLAPARNRVRADPSQIEQILMNLAVNAQDAMDQGGVMTIATDSVDVDECDPNAHPGVMPGPYVLLAVSDNGVGMDAGTIEHIFEPFFTTKEKGKGTGLGLASVYGVVKQHGGEIQVDSAPYHGTTIKIYLPRVEQHDTREEGAAAIQTFSGGETILVVEDNRTVRELTSRVLREHGYAVLEAGGPEECLLLTGEHKSVIHLLVADVILPGMNGKDLYLKLRGTRPGLKVLYMSGYTNDVINNHGVLDEGTRFIQKPYSVQGLVRKVREALDEEDHGRG
ncbi:MAG: PAS domain S-box protein [Vicinamibacteria bacterium]|nr:PAS domain S-box protein [Vicinamibacteria bacterium]